MLLFGMTPANDGKENVENFLHGSLSSKEDRRKESELGRGNFAAKFVQERKRAD